VGTTDGTVVSTTKVLDNGPDADHLVIAVLSEGYQNSELSQFETDVDDFINTFFNTPPFDQVELQQAFNIYRVNVSSTDSGTDDPDTCDGGAGTSVDTYFDSSLCWDGDIRRLLSADSSIVTSVLNTNVPAWDQALVLVNSPIRGGAGGSIAVASTGGSDWKEVSVHELGHSLFGLADEYGYYEGCGSGESGQDNHPSAEPSQPNVTVNTNRATLKWGDFVDPATSIPTTSNADCSDCDPQTSPVPAGTVGAFEGAHYYHCDCYRPEYNCIMRASSFGVFCKVCTRQICQVLAPYTSTVTLAEPSITFHDVPEGVTAPSAAVFDVDSSCAEIHFEIVSGPTVTSGPPGTTFGTEFGLEFKSEPTFNPRQAYVWITYTGTDDGDTATGTVTIRCLETEEDFVVPISANTVARPSVAVALALDKSGSMGYSSGIPGLRRIDVLHFSAPPFVDVLPEDNAIGIVSFDQNGYIDMAVSGPTGPIDVPDMTRATARTTILSHTHNPSGSTAIGDGLEEAHNILDPVTGYDVKATIVLTDGHETAAKYISEVTDLIDERVYAIGLGTADQIQPAALTALTNGSGGYTLMTGALNTDQYFRLTKYYLQILAGVRNADIVLDPEGFIKPGQVHRIPFTLAETDIDSDVILLSPFPQVIRFGLETPQGKIIQPGTGVPGVTYVQAQQNSYYRVTLPVVVDGVAAREGTWHALLAVDEKYYKRYLAQLEEYESSAVYGDVQAHGVRYSLNVYAYSNLRLRASLAQTSMEPGATMTVRAVLTEYGLPIESRAGVTAQLERPDGTKATLHLPEIEPGVFETSAPANQQGVYYFLVQASGKTLRDRPFTREQIVTGAVWQGGDRPFPGGDGDGGGRDDLCRLLACLLSENVLTARLRERLKEQGIDVDALLRCLKAWCRDERKMGQIAAADLVARLDPADLDALRRIGKALEAD
jgi:hypothetical protein